MIWSPNNATLDLPPNGYGNYKEAAAACTAMNTNNTLGYSSGWRLPTQSELLSLHNGGAVEFLPTSDGDVVGWERFNTWSSTYNGDGGHIFVNIGVDGYSTTIGDDTPNIDISCVH